mmetsp:Transcript_31681/g.88792  ORF Transcript_31681/g.88792 Transcript_31681/m.88792 type:complete len:267 (+) Transcript_31681:269-1069(+)
MSFVCDSIATQIRAHRSCRKFDASKTVERKTIVDIVDCATRTSSYGNLQSYCIISVTEKNVLSDLADIHGNENIRQCSVLFTFCADTSRPRQWLEARDAPNTMNDFLGFMVGTVDACIVAQTLVLAAEAKGLGCCFLGTTLWESSKIAKKLNMPTGVIPVTSVMVGWPEKCHFDIPPRCRLPLRAVWQEEKYVQVSNSELLEIYRGTEEAGEARYRAQSMEADECFKSKKIPSLAHYYAIKKYPKSLHERVSKQLLSQLRENDFLL